MTTGSSRPPLLTEAQKQVLLALARAAAVAQISAEPPVAAESIAMPEASGAFVTLTRHGQLRGCLGTLDCRDGVAREVARCAADAASRDTRFPPVHPRELADLAVEVSVLGPLEPIDPQEPDAVVIGRHGLVVEQGRRRGLLLPQVAPEHHWTPEQFLAQTCVKAGLPPDAWQRGARVYRFEAQVFGDDRGPV